MDDLEKEKFEADFKQAFSDAEITPSEEVWKNIELELLKANGGRVRQQIFFYKLVAAASLVLAVIAGGSFYHFQTKSQSDYEARLAEANEQLRAARELIAKAEENKQPSPAVESDRSQDQNVQITASRKGFEQLFSDESEKTVFVRTYTAVPATRSRHLPSLYPANPTLSFSNEAEEVDPVALMMAKLKAEEARYAEEDKKVKAELDEAWTSLGFAAGGFNAINPNLSGQSAFSDLNVQSAQDQAAAPGIAYSAGVSLGKRISTRWVLHGGVNYMTQSSSYVAEEAVFESDFRPIKAAAIGALPSDAPPSQQLVSTAPYQVNNQVQFLSVPLNAGYVLLDKKFGVQLNAGISTDFFIQNTIDPQGGSLEKTTQKSGEGAAYRTVNFSSLIATDFIYKIGPRYRVLLTPGLRYPLNSIYKDQTGITSTPVTVDVGLKFRYIFK